MALTYNSSRVQSEGDTYRAFVNVSPDTSYPAGGYSIRARDVRLINIQDLSVVNNPGGYLFYWNPTTQKLQIGDYSGGGGGGLTFTGTPMGNHVHPFTGVVMPAHTHALASVTEDITVNPDTYILTVGATGFFVVGETITGGTSAATATVTVGNSNPTSDLGFTPVLGSFTVGETITGGTSGVTATVASGWFSIYVPTRAPVLFEGGCRAAATGRSLSPTSSDANADLTITYDTLVGAFTDFEIITGGTSGSTATISFRQAGTLNVTQVAWTLPGFTLGETITGGTSGATAVVTSSQFAQRIVHRPTSSSNPTGDFIIFYPISVNMSPIRVTYLAADSNASTSAGTPTGTVDPNSAGTPAGTIGGGGGGASFAELTPGTNVAAVISNFDIIAEGL